MPNFSQAFRAADSSIRSNQEYYSSSFDKKGKAIQIYDNVFPAPNVDKRADNLIIVSRVMAEKAFTKLNEFFL